MIDDIYFLDFAMDHLSKMHPNGESIKSISVKYLKKNKLPFDDKDRRQKMDKLSDKYLGEYWESIDPFGILKDDVKITLEYKEIIKKYGSLSEYNNRQQIIENKKNEIEAVQASEKHSKKQFRENLEIKALKSQIGSNSNNLKYTKISMWITIAVSLVSVVVNVLLNK